MTIYILDINQFKINEYCEELPKHQRHYEAGQYLLRFALGEAVYKKAEFATGEHGKPYIKGYPIHYNISHSGQFVVLVVANSEVGVDVQKKKSIRMESMAKRYFAPKEWQVFEACETIDAQIDLFYHIWCRKEAYGKYLGVGLNEKVLHTDVMSEMPINSTDYTEGSADKVQIETSGLAECRFHDLSLREDYQISICSRKEEHIEKIIRVFEGL